jgi:hypothetical protein
MCNLQIWPKESSKLETTGQFQNPNFFLKCFISLNSFLRRGYLMEFADSTQNRFEIIGTPNQSIRMKIFPKKFV